MYAIVDIKDKQFKVEAGDTLFVPRHADATPDATVIFDRVLLVSDGAGDVTLGTPTVEGASVTARVIEEVKGDKILVFKKKRRKRYKVKRGHRQRYTKIAVEALNVNGQTFAAASASETPPAADTGIAGATGLAEEEVPTPFADTDDAITPLMTTPADVDAGEEEADRAAASPPADEMAAASDEATDETEAPSYEAPSEDRGLAEEEVPTSLADTDDAVTPLMTAPADVIDEADETGGADVTDGATAPTLADDTAPSATDDDATASDDDDETTDEQAT